MEWFAKTGCPSGAPLSPQNTQSSGYQTIPESHCSSTLYILWLIFKRAANADEEKTNLQIVTTAAFCHKKLQLLLSQNIAV